MRGGTLFAGMSPIRILRILPDEKPPCHRHFQDGGVQRFISQNFTGYPI